MKTISIKIFRWTLRIISGLFIVFTLFMFIGGIFDGGGKPVTINEILQFSIFGIGLIGFILAWKWELIGGIIALMAFVGLAIINPTVLISSLLLIFPITAILFIVLGAIGSNSRA